jgi:mannose-6-phosphate isomerase
MTVHTGAITGSSRSARPFPLLIKFLDAQDVLSVQVHPDRETCRRMGQGAPKTECWYIIAAESESYIYKGLKPGVTRAAFARAITNGTVEDHIVQVPVKPGECHFLPAGTLHAIGPGLLIAEIQLPSDTTYRVFDWNRVDASGKGRTLHIEQALESIHFDASDHLPVTTVGRLVDCDYFKVDKGHQVTGAQVLMSPGTMKILVMLTGSGLIESEEDNRVDFMTGDCLLVPACYEGVIRFQEDTEYLTCLV